MTRRTAAKSSAFPEGEPALAQLDEALDRVEARGITAGEVRAHLAALPKPIAGESPAATLSEIAAVASRLDRLAEGQAIDDAWEIQETLDHVAELVRTLGSVMLRTRLGAQAGEALSFIMESLAGVPEASIAILVGARPGQLATWRKNGVPKPKLERVSVTAQVVFELRRSMTAEGVMQWFSAERAQLDGHTPLDVIDSPDAHRVLRLARAPHSVLAH